MGNVRRVGFRGDSRSPKVIFNKGFLSRETGLPIHYRSRAYDTDRNSAVCFTWRLSASPYFPLNSKEKSTWIYVLNIDLSTASKDSIFNSRLNFINKKHTKIINKSTSKVANIHGAQYLDTMFLKNRDRIEQASTYLFADEMAAKEIKPKDILFAIECIRHFEDANDPSKGVRYQLIGPIIDNPKFKAGKLSAQMIIEARKLINSEIQLSAEKEISAPVIESGFQKNPMNEHKNNIFISVAKIPRTSKQNVAKLCKK